MKRFAAKTAAALASARTHTHVCLLARRSATLLALSGALTLSAMTQQAKPSDSSTGQSSSSSIQDQQKSQQTPPEHKSVRQINPQLNPFPKGSSPQAAQQQSQPARTPAAPDTDQQAPQPAPKSAAQDNPFPEDVSKGAAAAKDNDASSSSSSSSSNGDWSSSSNAGGDVDPNADLPRENGRRKLRKPSGSDIESGSLAGEGRAAEDVRVGHFYLGIENFKAAYGRYSDAVRLDPTNLNAIYGLAVAAAGLHRKDEALTNYKLYLQIAPEGDNAKAASKALRGLSK